uniref:DEAD (Asp-Glu-Ala-Asp) box helicase 21 n=1 Tax=Erpetoichthys calabaricus TaxID=27687 RepID=A0A8C4TD64_ERPCA
YSSKHQLTAERRTIMKNQKGKKVSKDEKKLRKQVLNELTLKMQLISHSKEEPSPKGDNETEVKEKLQNKKRVVFLILGFLQKLNLLKARGIIYLFDIQSKIFNYVYDGNAVIAQAHTGTGKTFSFAIPLIEKLQSDALERKMGRPPKVLVLTLTRELAKKIQRYNQKTGNSMLYGGTAYNPQIDAIRNGIDILEGTPGYIKDHLRNNKLNLSKLKHVVLDEADHMLDVSFAEQVEEILVSAYKKGSEDNPQTLLFSATCPNWVYDVAKKYMRTKFEQVELIGKKTKKTTTIAEHLAIGCHWSQQAAVIGDIIQVYSGSHYHLFYQHKEEDQLRFVETRVGITSKQVDVPTANDIIKASGKDAVGFLDAERGAIEALAAALVHISGVKSIEQCSLLICFDVPAASLKTILGSWKDSRRWQPCVATEHPELEEVKRSGERVSSSFGKKSFHGDGKRNDRFNNRGQQKRSFCLLWCRL